MKPVCRLLVALVCVACCAQCAQLPPQESQMKNAPAQSLRQLVVLDIGHRFGDEGAVSPRAVEGKRLKETSFWYEYCYYTKKVIEDAGYRCIVCNRGDEPADPRMQAFAKRAGVVHLHQKQKSGRYASTVHPDRFSAGQISADFAIRQGAACAVFLHHNGLDGWSTRGENSSVLYNQYNGRQLADSLCAALNAEVLNHGMDNKGKPCTPSVRRKAAAPSAGWMNACDDSGIPAAVIEAAYLSNANHVAYLVNDANARKYAECIGRGIVGFLKSPRPAPHLRADDSVPDEGSFGRSIKY